MSTIAILGDLIFQATTGQGLANMIRTWIAPLFLLAIGLAALTFLIRRQMMEFFQFFALAIFVALFFYYPNVVEKVAAVIAPTLGGTKA